MSITLIVATTPSMGIGVGGTLPWPTLRAEMAYFARVTRRAPPDSLNAVIMGRKTWTSIPPNSRPLKGRLNVIISRTPETLGFDQTAPSSEQDGASPPREAIIAASGLPEAIAKLAQLHSSKHNINQIFVIGGAEVYESALALDETKRILRTKISNELTCDTFFPLRLGEDQAWTRQSQAQLDQWAGENVPSGMQSEGGIEWEFELWERRAK